MLNRLRLAMVTAMLMACFGGVASAQTARVSGKVTDPAGSVVPTAVITVQNVETGVKSNAESNAEGYFTLPRLRPGPYQVTVTKLGFKPVVQSGITLLADDWFRLDFSLQVGEIAQSVEVHADATLLQVDSAVAGGSITSREFDRLALLQNGRIRNPSQFYYLQPGVQGLTTPTGQDNTAATNQVSINGSPTLNTELAIDGMSAGQTRFVGDITLGAPTVEAVQEFRVQSSQISAEYGHTGAAVVNFVIKSGTNNLHGSAYEYFRNDKLDARNWFAPVRAVERNNEYGFSVGGPVFVPKVYNGKGRTFFFFNYGAARKRGLTNLQQVRVPTAQELAGDFSGSGHATIYDPLSTAVTSAGAISRDLFPGNKIPVSRFDPVAVNVNKNIPPPNLPGATLNFQGPTGQRLLDPASYTTKIDHNISAKQKLWASYIYTGNLEVDANTPLPSPYAVNGDNSEHEQSHKVRLADDYFIRPTLLNDFSFGYNRFFQPVTEPTQFEGWTTKLGVKGVPGAGFPMFTFTNGYTSLAGMNYSVQDVDQSYLLRDAVTWTRNRHVLKFGFEMRRQSPNTRGFTNTSGTFGFSNLETALPSNPGATGDAFASFLLGAAHNSSVSYPSTVGIRRPYWGFFVQDDIKVSTRLTVNIGLRYEIEQAPYEAANRYSIIDLATPNPGAGNLPGALVFAGDGTGRLGRRALARTDFSAIGPRIGFAWGLDKRTVIRGGYGIYYSSTYLSPSTAGFFPSASFISQDNGVTPALYLQNGMPPYVNTPTLSPTLLNGQGGNYLEYTAAEMPRTQNYSFGVQRKLTSNLIVEARYLGNHNTRQTAQQLVNINQLPPQYLSLGSLLLQGVTSPAAVAAGIPIPYPGFTGSVAQALRPFPQYTTLTAAVAKAGSSSYNSMTAEVRKRMSFGLSLNFSYTFSKNLGDAPASSLPGGGNFNTNMGQDNYNRQIERSISAIDVTHALLLTYAYDLPFGRGRHWASSSGVADKVFGGWTVSAIQRYQSGIPMGVLMNNTLPIFNRVLRPNRVPGQQAATGISNGDFNPATDLMINPAAFSAPAPFTFGNSAPYIQDLRSYPLLNEDLQMTKIITLHERATFEFYGQFLNAFNRHRFVVGDTNFSNTTFGRVTAASTPRYIQLGARIRF